MDSQLADAKIVVGQGVIPVGFSCDCKALADMLCECKKLVLSKTDAELFAKQILDPDGDHEPNGALQKARAEYLKAIKEGRLVVKD